MLKRFTLFFLTNILIIVTLSLVLNLLGVRPYITESGLDYNALLIFCFVWGMGGALISLAISRVAAKWMMGVKVISPNSPSEYAWLVSMVTRLSQSAGLPAVPEIGVFQSPVVNAFATGPTKKRSLVAFSSGLLNNMSRDEVEGVAGHEIAHIQNGDMVTMTLIQGVVNACIMFLARIIAWGATQGMKEESRPLVSMLIVIGLEIALGLFGMIVVGWFSRQREFRADRGSATIAGREKMIGALQSLQRAYGQQVRGGDEHASLATLQISGKSGGFLSLFSTHPPLEDRIRALKEHH